MRPFEDPMNEGNYSGRYMTGKTCLIEGCRWPAGTAWSPLWCVDHNISRMHQIEDSMRVAARAVIGATR